MYCWMFRGTTAIFVLFFKVDFKKSFTISCLPVERWIRVLQGPSVDLLTLNAWKVVCWANTIHFLAIQHFSTKSYQIWLMERLKLGGLFQLKMEKLTMILYLTWLIIIPFSKVRILTTVLFKSTTTHSWLNDKNCEKWSPSRK